MRANSELFFRIKLTRMEINISLSLVCPVLGLKIVGWKDFIFLPLDVLPKHYMGSPGAQESPCRGRHRLLAALACTGPGDHSREC